MNEKMLTRTLFFTDEKSDREERGASGDHNKKENKEAAEILLLGQPAYLALRRRQDCQPIKREDHGRKNVPGRNSCTREPEMSTQRKERRCTGEQSQNQTLARVRTANKIDNAHLWSRVKAQIIPNNLKR